MEASVNSALESFEDLDNQESKPDKIQQVPQGPVETIDVHPDTCPFKKIENAEYSVTRQITSMTTFALKVNDLK